jgi:hypothetical protein
VLLLFHGLPLATEHNHSRLTPPHHQWLTPPPFKAYLLQIRAHEKFHRQVGSILLCFAYCPGLRASYFSSVMRVFMRCTVWSSLSPSRTLLFFSYFLLINFPTESEHCLGTCVSMIDDAVNTQIRGPTPALVDAANKTILLSLHRLSPAYHPRLSTGSLSTRHAR